MNARFVLVALLAGACAQACAQTVGTFQPKAFIRATLHNAKIASARLHAKRFP